VKAYSATPDSLTVLREREERISDILGRLRGDRLYGDTHNLYSPETGSKATMN